MPDGTCEDGACDEGAGATSSAALTLVAGQMGTG
jgi:hypothetical protein